MCSLGILNGISSIPVSDLKEKTNQILIFILLCGAPKENMKLKIQINSYFYKIF